MAEGQHQTECQSSEETALFSTVLISSGQDGQQLLKPNANLMDSIRVIVTALVKEGFGLRLFSGNISLRLDGISNGDSLKEFSFQF